MAKYGFESKMNPEKIVEKALNFFGEGGMNLNIVDQSACCAQFTGGGGHIDLFTISGKRGKTKVIIETREWDRDVRKFMVKIRSLIT